MAAGDEQPGIAAQVTCQDLFHRQGIVNARQALHDFLDPAHLHRITGKVARVDRTLVDARGITFGGYQHQLVASLEQLVGRHAELVEVVASGVALAVLQGQLVLAGQQHQHFSLGRSVGADGKQSAGNSQGKPGHLGHATIS